MNLNDNKKYNFWFKNSWSYITGAILLSLFQIITLIVTKEPWGITSGFAYSGAWIFESLGGDVSSWEYFSKESAKKTLNLGLLNDPYSLRNLGLIFGALFSTLLASHFKFRKVKSIKQVILASIGGLLMGYGARLALGCNIGAFFSSIASLSLSGWIFGLFMFLGSIVGGKILIRWLI
ncbi:MAG: YeeE/YedE family protein [Firmicutes bacterium]|nr:YeeE/YedE family protein [Bacillota bacterium]